MSYLEQELTIDDDGLANFGPALSEVEIMQGEATFNEFGALRRAVMTIGLTKSREELVKSCQSDPKLSAELIDMAVRAFEQHQLALQFLQVAMARLVIGTAKAKIDDTFTAEQDAILGKAIDIAFSKAYR